MAKKAKEPLFHLFGYPVFESDELEGLPVIKIGNWTIKAKMEYVEGRGWTLTPAAPTLTCPVCGEEVTPTATGRCPKCGDVVIVEEEDE